MNEDDYGQGDLYSPPPTPQPAPSPDDWSGAHEIRLQKLNQSLAGVDDDFASGSISQDVAEQTRRQILEQRQPLVARKEASQQAQKQQAVHEAMHAQALQRAMIQADAEHDTRGFSARVQHYVHPETGDVTGFYQPEPNKWEPVPEKAKAEGLDYMPDPGAALAVGETADPQQHTLTINGQDFTYNRTPNGWQAEGASGGPSQAEIDAQHQYEQNGGYVDPGLAQRALLDRAARAQGGIVPPGRPRDDQVQAKSAAGTLTNAEIAQVRAKAAMALAQSGLRPGARGYGTALSHQIALFSGAALRQKQHESDYANKEKAAAAADQRKQEHEQRQKELKEKGDGYEQNIKHFIDVLDKEKKHNQEKGYEQPEYVKDYTSIHEEAEKRAAELFKSKHGHYPEGFLKKQQQSVGQTQQQPGEPKPANLPVVPAGKAGLPELLAEKARREAAKRAVPAEDFNRLTGSVR